jgi:7-keto-8-aminopelargonate synthetase-like enzyme
MKSELSALPGVLKGSLREYRIIEGADLLKRVDSFYKWQDARRRQGYWPYGRSTDAGPKSICAVADDVGQKSEGVNFGSQDYLSLSDHPAIRAAAHEAIDLYGVHSAGSAAFMGNTGHSVALEKKISEFLGMERVVLYPTGYAAGAGAIKAWCDRAITS